MRRRDVILAAGAVACMGPSSGCAGRGDDPYEPLDTLPIPRAADGVVGPDGSTGYVATITGFGTVDLTAPSDLTLLADRGPVGPPDAGEPLRGVLDVAVDGDLLVVPGGSPGDVLHGFLVYDVGDPAAPRRLAFQRTDYPIHNVSAADGRAYLAGPNHLGIYRLGDDPRRLGRWSVAEAAPAWASVRSDDSPWPARLWQLHDVHVQDDTAFLAQWDAGTWIVDVSDPASPEPVGRVGGRTPAELAELTDREAEAGFHRLPGNHHSVGVDEEGTLVAVGREAWGYPATDPEGGPAGIELWDVSTRSSPTKLGTVPPPPSPDGTQEGVWTTAHNLDLAGDRLFTSWYQGGIKLFDVADPSAPEELAWWREPSTASFVTAKRVDDAVVFAVDGAINSPDGTEAVYAFPNRAGDQRDPPPLSGTRDGSG